MESLRDLFEEQASWRRAVAVDYPADERNLLAAEIFDQLAATADKVPDELLTAFDELFDDLPDQECLLEMLRAIGFRSAPATAEEFVRDFIANRTTRDR
jgi:hypothetical protein